MNERKSYFFKSLRIGLCTAFFLSISLFVPPCHAQTQTILPEEFSTGKQVKASTIKAMRDAVDAKRLLVGLPKYPYADNIAAGSLIRARHFAELGLAVRQIYNSPSGANQNIWQQYYQQKFSSSFSAIVPNGNQQTISDAQIKQFIGTPIRASTILDIYNAINQVGFCGDNTCQNYSGEGPENCNTCPQDCLLPSNCSAPVLDFACGGSCGSVNCAAGEKCQTQTCPLSVNPAAPAAACNVIYNCVVDGACTPPPTCPATFINNTCTVTMGGTTGTQTGACSGTGCSGTVSATCGAGNAWTVTGSCTVSGPVCGDGTCNGSEDGATCPADCCGANCVFSADAVCASGCCRDDWNTLNCGTDQRCYKWRSIFLNETCDRKCPGYMPPQCQNTTCSPQASGGACTSFCGNGYIDFGEDCEGAKLNNQTCQTQGFTSGTLGCNSSCKFDTSSCVGPVSCPATLTNNTCTVNMTATTGTGVTGNCGGGCTGTVTANCSGSGWTVTSGSCTSGATCFDGIPNQGEVGVDCGGPCAKSCDCAAVVAKDPTDNCFISWSSGNHLQSVTGTCQGPCSGTLTGTCNSGGVNWGSSCSFPACANPITDHNCPVTMTGNTGTQSGTCGGGCNSDLQPFTATCKSTGWEITSGRCYPCNFVSNNGCNFGLIGSGSMSGVSCSGASGCSGTVNVQCSSGVWQVTSGSCSVGSPDWCNPVDCSQCSSYSGPQATSGYWVGGAACCFLNCGWPNCPAASMQYTFEAGTKCGDSWSGLGSSPGYNYRPARRTGSTGGNCWYAPGDDYVSDPGCTIDGSCLSQEIGTSSSDCSCKNVGSLPTANATYLGLCNAFTVYQDGSNAKLVPSCTGAACEFFCTNGGTYINSTFGCQ